MTKRTGAGGGAPSRKIQAGLRKTDSQENHGSGALAVEPMWMPLHCEASAGD